MGVGLTFAALLHNWEYRKLTWVMFGLIAVCGALQGVPALAQVQEAPRATTPLDRRRTRLGP